MKFKLGKTYLFGMFIICLIAIINFHVVSYVAVLWVDALAPPHNGGQREWLNRRLKVKGASTHNPLTHLKRLFSGQRSFNDSYASLMSYL